VKLNFAPGAKLPLSNAPVSLVTVCVVVSLFVHVTVVPTGTLAGLGANAWFPSARAPTWIDTATPAGGVGVVGVVGVEDPPHETANDRIAAESTNRDIDMRHESATLLPEAAVRFPPYFHQRAFSGLRGTFTPYRMRKVLSDRLVLS
jgi:hypothetical protein